MDSNSYAVFLVGTTGFKGIPWLKGIWDGAETVLQDCVHTPGSLRATSQTLHEKCLEEGGAPFFAFYLRPRGCKDRTKEQEDKGLKAEGWRLIPHWQGHFEIKDGRIIPTKGSLTCAVALWGPRSYWPTSVLCVADGRRKGPNESSWSRRWNPCSRWRLRQHLHPAQLCVSDTINHSTGPSGTSENQF